VRIGGRAGAYARRKMEEEIRAKLAFVSANPTRQFISRQQQRERQRQSQVTVGWQASSAAGAEGGVESGGESGSAAQALQKPTYSIKLRGGFPHPGVQFLSKIVSELFIVQLKYLPHSPRRLSTRSKPLLPSDGLLFLPMAASPPSQPLGAEGRRVVARRRRGSGRW